MENNIVPIYTSQGDAVAFLQYPYLHDYAGEWIGFVNAQREVYSVLGDYVGKLTSDPRIIRSRSGEGKPRQKPPAPPTRLRISSAIPLPKLMADLTSENIDILQDEPERLHTLDSGEMRQDMD